MALFSFPKFSAKTLRFDPEMFAQGHPVSVERLDEGKNVAPNFQAVLSIEGGCRTNITGIPKVIHAVKKTPEFVRKTGHFITPWAGNFYYYKVAVGQEVNGLIRMTSNLPPVLREGFFCLNRAVYFVPLQDLRRGVIRASRKVRISNRALTYQDFLDATRNAANGSTDQSASSSSNFAGSADSGVGLAGSTASDVYFGTQAPAIADASLVAPVRRVVPPSNVSFGDSTRLAGEIRGAGVANQEQISALLNLEDPEEEWEIEDDSQP